MGELIKSLFGGFSRFVLSWLLPSVATLGVFVIFVYPVVSSSAALRPVSQVTQSTLGKSVVFALSAMLLGTLLSLASLPVYRLLEGYTLPRPVRRWLLRRQIRIWLRLRISARRTTGEPSRRGLDREQLDDYPSRCSRLMPTRLGNAFKAAETFGLDRYRLNSQIFWYELTALVPEQARKDEEDARASVDFFVSFVAHLALLGLVSLYVAAATGSNGALVIGLASGFLGKLAYDAAVRNMTDWRYAVQAMVNLGRIPLAAGLGYRIPMTLHNEQKMWAAWAHFVQDNNQVNISKFDAFRTRYEKPS